MSGKLVNQSLLTSSSLAMNMMESVMWERLKGFEPDSSILDMFDAYGMGR